jgi:exodeoxyribonuclease V alpha subunit
VSHPADTAPAGGSAEESSAVDGSAVDGSAVHGSAVHGSAVDGADAPAFEPGDVRLARRAPDALRPWNALGVVVAADVHVAVRLAAIGGDDAPEVLLGVALAVRALRLGHVCVELTTVAGTVSIDGAPGADLSALPWPDPGAWRDRLTASPLVAEGEAGGVDRPLRLVGDRLYLDRYWRQERQVAADLTARAARSVVVDEVELADGIQRLWPGSGPPGLGAAAPAAGGPEGERPPGWTGGAAPDEGTEGPGLDLQALAAGTTVRRGVAVVAGGPGTGKTTTVARILALLADQARAAGGLRPRVALVAPTGKAAARLEEAVHAEAARMPVDPGTRAWLLALRASTIHRLLGRRPDSESRFRHDRRQRLPHDTVIVDETSMVSLSLMANLLDAVRPDARVVLVGDPEQLASVEAGAVLGDIVGPAAAGPVAPGSMADAIVVLCRVHRFGGGIAELARAIQAGDGARAAELVTSGGTDIRLVDTGAPAGGGLATVRDLVVATFERVTAAANAGDGAAALDGLGAARVLCAHRQGPAGVGVWTQQIEGWLASAIPGYGAGGAWYLGRPLMVTVNDYELQLFNGDTGVVAVGPDGQPSAVFERRGELTWTSPARLRAIDTVYAMTVHKSQGSQFDEVVVVLPEPSSPILTRQLLYTAVTRARRRVTLVGSAASVVAAVDRPITRASGLQERLWGPSPADGPARRGDATV